jgi:hypothetical protein
MLAASVRSENFATIKKLCDTDAVEYERLEQALANSPLRGIDIPSGPTSSANWKATGTWLLSHPMTATNVYRSNVLTLQSGGAGVIRSFLLTVRHLYCSYSLTWLEAFITARLLQKADEKLFWASCMQQNGPEDSLGLAHYWFEKRRSWFGSFGDPIPILSPRLWQKAKGLLRIFVNGVRIFGDILEAIQNAQRERARSGFHRQLKCSATIKALHKPLQVIPQSIHPIDLAA